MPASSAEPAAEPAAAELAAPDTLIPDAAPSGTSTWIICVILLLTFCHLSAPVYTFTGKL